MATLSGHQQPITELIVLDKKQIASGSSDKSVKVWSVITNLCLYTLEGHSKTITNISYIPDMKQLISCSSDDTIRIWNLETLKCVKVIQNGEAY